MKKNEEKIQLAISKYLQVQYPNVIFTSEASGGKKTKGQAMLAKRLRSGNGLPDLIILEARQQFHGLMLELKQDGYKLRKKDGSFVSEHIREQNEVLQRMRSKGYFAEFAIGFEQAKSFIDRYMNL